MVSICRHEIYWRLRVACAGVGLAAILIIVLSTFSCGHVTPSSPSQITTNDPNCIYNILPSPIVWFAGITAVFNGWLAFSTRELWRETGRLASLTENTLPRANLFVRLKYNNIVQWMGALTFRPEIEIEISNFGTAAAIIDIIEVCLTVGKEPPSWNETRNNMKIYEYFIDNIIASNSIKLERFFDSYVLKGGVRYIDPRKIPGDESPDDSDAFYIYFRVCYRSIGIRNFETRMFVRFESGRVMPEGDSAYNYQT